MGEASQHRLIPKAGGDTWFGSPLGTRFLRDEQRVVARALETVFGEHLLQLGSWGLPGTFLANARTQRKSLVDWVPGAGADVVCAPDRLALTSDSVDAIILPHTLESATSPHALLREVDRVLRADGHLVILSFAAGGLWGLRRFVSPHGFPDGRRKLIREGRLCDWLELLSFTISARYRYCHTVPISRSEYFARMPDESFAGRWFPFLNAGVCLVAQKRVYPVTPLRQPWRSRRLRVVGGLVEPTTRSQRESS